MARYQNYPAVTHTDLRALVRTSAARFGEKTFCLQRRKKEYQAISFRRFAADVNALGTALCAKGLKGKTVLLAGDNCYEWVCAYMALICGVGVVVPVTRTLSTEAFAELAQFSNASAVIHSLPPQTLEKLDPSVASIPFDGLESLLRLGRSRLAAGDRTFLDFPIDPDAACAIVFTSGTTDKPKGVMLSHRNLCFSVAETCRMVRFDESDVFLSVLPLHHVCQSTCGFLCPLSRGSTVAFGRGLHGLSRDLRQIQPTVMLGVPRLLETMYERVSENIRRTGMEKKIQRSIAFTNAIPNPEARLSAKRLLFAEIHKSFGGRLRLLISVGTATEARVLCGWRDLGITAIQGYTLTETASISAINRDRFFNDASAGMSLPHAMLDIFDMKDDGTGEIRYRGDNVMLGYFNRPDLTREVKRDGWLYTGDVGYLDEDGFLYVMGRKNNEIVTADQKNIFPEELEALLNRTPFVRESVVVGYFNPVRRDYDTVAILHPDYDALTERCGSSPSEKEVELELRRAVSLVNGSVASHKRIRQLLIAKEAFPKTASRRLRRADIAKTFEVFYQPK